MTSCDYDVAVVGGGIQGTGVAQAAAAAGHSVLLLELTALGSGTSSRSTKLIHGGLRYLETAEFSLVRESLDERALLLRLAPELVKMRRFTLPVFRQTRRRPWQIRTGLTLYSMLANFRRQARFSTVPKKDWDKLDGLRTNDLQAVFRYSDAQTNDRKLTSAVMRSAQSLGAELRMPASLQAAHLTGRGCQLDYHYDGKQHTCTAKVLINAAGPWVNLVAKRVTPQLNLPEIETVQGAHILLTLGDHKGYYYTESPRDGRAIFVLPWEGRLMVGTTESKYKGEPADVRPLASEKSYLLSVLRHYFPRHAATSVDDIIDAFAGLRVLPGGAGHAFHRSREVILRTDRRIRPRVLSIYGGKLTAYRVTAEKVLKRIAGSLPLRRPVDSTRRLPLTPDD